jgi:hypothetical protein
MPKIVTLAHGAIIEETTIEPITPLALPGIRVKRQTKTTNAIMVHLGRNLSAKS